jgi:hypothetical protein
MSIDMEGTFVIPSAVHARRFDAETVILDLEGGKYFGLDEVGSEVWDRLSRGESPSRIAEALVEVFDVELPVVRADVVELIQKLVAEGLLAEARR